MKRVVIESPLKGDRELNKLYARVCALHCLIRDESPYASHLFFDHADLLDDAVGAERQLGIKAGFSWGEAARVRAFYLDLGESEGMKLGRLEAARLMQDVDDRRLFRNMQLSAIARDTQIEVLHSLRHDYRKLILERASHQV